MFSIQERRREGFNQCLYKFSHDTIYIFIYQKTNNQRIVCYYQKLANQTANDCFFCCESFNTMKGYPGSEQHTEI